MANSKLQLALLQAQTRRHFLRTMGSGLGTLFVGTSLAKYAGAIETSKLDFSRDPTNPLSALPPQFAAKVKRVIYLHMAGAPSQLELFEHKPDLKRLDGQDCPASFLAGKRFAFISGVPKLLGSQYPFRQAGQSGPMDLRPPAPFGRTCGRYLLCQVHAYRPVQPRPGATVGAYRERAAWVSFVRLLGALWIGHGEPEFARVHCVVIGRKVAGRRQATVEFWIPA